MTYDAFALVLLLMALGKLAARRFADNASEVLNAFVLYLCLPAAVLRYASRLTLDPDVLIVAAVPWALLALSVPVVHALASALKFRRDERAALLLCVPLGNTSFLGYPLTQALLGEAALPYAVIYDQFGSFLMLSTYGLWVLARYGGDEEPSARLIAGKLLRFPPLLALLAALTVMPAEPPPLLAAILQRLSEAMLPIVAFAVGLSLRLRLPRGELAPLAVGLTLKLALLPLAAVALIAAFDLAPTMHWAIVLESAMPPMMTAAALAISHRLAPSLAAALVGYGTVVALASLPFIVWVAV